MHSSLLMRFAQHLHPALTFYTNVSIWQSEWHQYDITCNPTLSTTEAKFIAAVEAGKAIKWTQNILQEFGYPISQPSTLLINSQSALTMSKNPEHHRQMEHLNLKYFWLCDQVETGIIAPIYIPTSDQLVNIFTKALLQPTVEKLHTQLGLKN